MKLQIGILAISFGLVGIVTFSMLQGANNTEKSLRNLSYYGYSSYSYSYSYSYYSYSYYSYYDYYYSYYYYDYYYDYYYYDYYYDYYYYDYDYYYSYYFTDYYDMDEYEEDPRRFNYYDNDYSEPYYDPYFKEQAYYYTYDVYYEDNYWFYDPSTGLVVYYYDAPMTWQVGVFAVGVPILACIICIIITGLCCSDTCDCDDCTRCCRRCCKGLGKCYKKVCCYPCDRCVENARREREMAKQVANNRRDQLIKAQKEVEPAIIEEEVQRRIKLIEESRKVAEEKIQAEMVKKEVENVVIPDEPQTHVGVGGERPMSSSVYVRAPQDERRSENLESERSYINEMKI